MKKVILKNVVLSYVGFTTYIAIEVCYRSRSHWLMGICGALALLILDKINNYISWDMDILLQGCIGSALITGMEFIIGNLSLAGVLPKMWDYSNVWLNYKGIICLPFSLIWIVLSICAIMLADAINYYIFDELPIPYYRLFGKVIIKFKEKKINKE
jgi:uncharacterized membrane protein